MDLGGFSLRNLLARARGMGNQPHHIFAQPRTTSYASHGGPTASLPHVDFVRITLGRDRADQYRDCEHAPILPVVASISPAAQVRTIGGSIVRARGCLSREPVA